MKTQEQIGREVIEAHYGLGTEWEEPNEYGEEGFTRAQAESDIDADDIRGLIEEAILIDRRQAAEARAECDHNVLSIRKNPMPRTTDIIDAWEEFDGDVDAFLSTWDRYLTDKDFPCVESPSGLHDVVSGRCDLCGDTNRRWP